MDTLTSDREPELDFTADQLPGRPRRRFLTKLTVPLLGLLLAAAGFLAGIEVEKGRTASGSTGGLATSAASRGFAARFAGASGGSHAGSGRFPGASGSGSRSGFSHGGGFPAGGFGGFGGAGGAGGGTTGTISSISGKSIVLKTTSGNSITVTLTSATTLKKDLRVGRNSIRPGDTITVEGITGKAGSIKASSVSDSGAASTGSSGSGSSGSSSSGSGAGSGSASSS